MATKKTKTKTKKRALAGNAKSRAAVASLGSTMTRTATGGADSWLQVRLPLKLRAAIVRESAKAGTTAGAIARDAWLAWLAAKGVPVALDVDPRQMALFGGESPAGGAP